MGGGALHVASRTLLLVVHDVLLRECKALCATSGIIRRCAVTQINAVTIILSDRFIQLLYRHILLLLNFTSRISFIFLPFLLFFVFLIVFGLSSLLRRLLRLLCPEVILPLNSELCVLNVLLHVIVLEL